MAVEVGLSVYVVGGQGVRLFVVVVSCGVLDVFLHCLSTQCLSTLVSRYICFCLIVQCRYMFMLILVRWGNCEIDQSG